MYNDIKEEFCSIAIKESSDLIDRIEEHPFYVELMNGKLSYKKFKFYVQQTFLCLVDCTRAFLIIASRANDIETMDKLTFIARKIFSMRSLCEEQFTECNSSDSHKRSKSSSALIDFFMRAAYHNSVAESLAASYPCFGMCQITFQHTVKDSIPSSNKYKKWINLYNTNIEHPFNVKLANNTLNIENFKFYAQQKTLFLGDYIRTTLITASRMEDYSSIISLTEVAQRAVTVNRVLYNYYFTMYGISRGKKSLECFNFTNFLLSISYSNTYEAMTVLYSCMFIYKTVVDSMKNRFKKNNRYRDWFNFCYSDSVKSGCIILENIIDGYCSRARENEKSKMLELFRITAQFVLDFLNGAYNFSRFNQFPKEH